MPPRKSQQIATNAKNALHVINNRFEQRQLIQHFYFNEHLSAHAISKQLHIDSRTVYSHLAALGGQPDLQLEYPAADALQDSVLSLAALANKIREKSERDLSPLEPTDRRNHYYEWKAEVDMYATLYDRVFPMLEGYWARSGRKAPDLPSPETLKKVEEYDEISVD